MKYSPITFLILSVLFCFFPLKAGAEVKRINAPLDHLNTVMQQQIKDKYVYSGLAQFYNGLHAFVVRSDGVEKLGEQPMQLKENQWVAIVGHYNVLAFQHPGLTIRFNNQTIQCAGIDSAPLIQAVVLPKSELGQVSPALLKLKYVHLWKPFRLLCLGVEHVLAWINAMHYQGWGVSIILFSIFFKLCILPANILLVRAQRKVSHIQAKLAPTLAQIKSQYSGEVAHQKVMDAHQASGVSPFYTLKPLLLTVLPIPFLIAIFNVLGEMDQLAGSSFLWIQDLTRPDAYHSAVNLLPILMTVFTLFAAWLHQNTIVTQQELKKQKFKLYGMAFCFLILFYCFPAAMVLYWTLANVWQLIQQRLIKI